MSIQQLIEEYDDISTEIRRLKSELKDFYTQRQKVSDEIKNYMSARGETDLQFRDQTISLEVRESARRQSTRKIQGRLTEALASYGVRDAEAAAAAVLAVQKREKQTLKIKKGT